MKVTVIPTLDGFQIDIDGGSPPYEIYYLGTVLIYKGSNPLFHHVFNKTFNTKDFFYVVKDSAGGTVVVEPGKETLDRYEVGFIREILKREHLVLLRKGGFEIKVFKRKKPAITDPCPNCRSGLDKFLPPADDLGSEITVCEYCFGVGLEGGYYPPITVLGNYYNIQDIRADLLEPVRITNFAFYILNYPLLEKEDLIWSETLGKMLRIVNTQPFTYKGIPIKQAFLATELEAGHPAYRLSREIPVVITESGPTILDSASV